VATTLRGVSSEGAGWGGRGEKNERPNLGAKKDGNEKPGGSHITKRKTARGKGAQRKGSSKKRIGGKKRGLVPPPSAGGLKRRVRLSTRKTGQKKNEKWSRGYHKGIKEKTLTSLGFRGADGARLWKHISWQIEEEKVDGQKKEGRGVPCWDVKNRGGQSDSIKCEWQGSTSISTPLNKLQKKRGTTVGKKFWGGAAQAKIKRKV